MRTASLAFLLVALAVSGQAVDATAQSALPSPGVWQGNATVRREGQTVPETLILTLPDPDGCRAGATASRCVGTLRFDTVRVCSILLGPGAIGADGRTAHGVVFADGGWCTLVGWNGAARVELAPAADGGAALRLTVPGQPDSSIETTLARTSRD